MFYLSDGHLQLIHADHVPEVSLNLGSNSDCLSIIPGAGDSTTQRYCTSILPELKIKLPSGSRMDPIAKSPKRIEANLDIAFTFAPSERRFLGLSNNAPISKFK